MREKLSSLVRPQAKVSLLEEIRLKGIACRISVMDLGKIKERERQSHCLLSSSTRLIKVFSSLRLRGPDIQDRRVLREDQLSCQKMVLLKEFTTFLRP